MFRYLIIVTTYLLCAISILFTGLFALHLSSVEINFTTEWTIKDYVSPLLMVAVGLCIDLSKYIFWQQRDQHRLVFGLSLVLAVFSWAASVAFFVSQSTKHQESERKNTAAYRLYEAKVERLKQDIAFYEQLSQKHLNSRYHAQWEKSRDAREHIRQLNQSLAQMAETEPNIGMVESRQLGTVSAFFEAIATLLYLPANVVSLIAFACLAALIECCSFAILSLDRQRHFPEPKETENVFSQYKKQQTREKHEHQLALMREQVINGTADPKIAQLSKEYRLRYPIVKSLLETLVEQGVLIKQSNRYLRISKP